jgi:2-methylfumaryl-CoA hydratase
MSNKGSIQNFFEDFTLGQEFACPTPRVMTEADRVAYIAFTGDRTPRFCDRRGLVHPLIVFHTVLGQTVRHISLNAQANLGYAELMWKKSVQVGDEIRTSASIVGLKENSSQTSGIVYVKTEGRNQHHAPVLEYIRWVMVKKNRKDATPYLAGPVIPTLCSSVPVDRLMLHPSDPFDVHATGGRFFFDDYAVGERIIHLDGMTINSSDHMSFTRLYQNSARVHFDAMLTEGKPLVYGGLPISVGYAHSFSGFENRLGIVAINGGSHVNPTLAGDTLYTMSEILDRVDITSTIGALRVRMVVVKNLQLPLDGTFAARKRDTNTGKETYNPHVVLDLDYWELMAKRSTQ